MSSFLFSKIKKEILLAKFKHAWRKRNNDNLTVPTNIFDVNSVEVGKYTYGELCVKTFGCKNNKLIIGNFCSIAENSIFLLAGEHQFDGMTTYPYRKKVLNLYGEDVHSKGNIVIEDDVWIGERCIILSGVKIGQGAVIGAGTVVAKNVPPYAIYAGNRILKYRFESDVIKKMLLFDFSGLTPSDFKQIDRIDNITDFINSDLYKSHLKNKID